MDRNAQIDKEAFALNARKLLTTYAPSPAVMAHIANLDLTIVVGPTSVGKTSIMEQSGIAYVPSDVTREPRKDERNGVEYNFRDDYDQLWRELNSGEFVQYVVSETGFYGTKSSSYPGTGPCTMAVYANAVEKFKAMGFRNLRAVYILPPTFQEWMKRAEGHHDSDLMIRMREAKESMEIALSSSDYYFVINEDLEQATETFKLIAGGTLPDLANQEHARDVALQLLAQIDID